MMRVILICCAALLLAGCASPGGQPGGRVSVKLKQLDRDVYQYVVVGHQSNLVDKMQDATLYAIADSVKKLGKTHLIVLSQVDTTKTDYELDQSYDDDEERPEVHLYKSVRPSREGLVRVIAVAEGKAPPTNSLSAEVLLKNYHEKRKKKS